MYPSADLSVCLRVVCDQIIMVSALCVCVCVCTA